jgi:hypothetical protein
MLPTIDALKAQCKGERLRKCGSLLDEVQPYSEGYMVLLHDIYSLELE